MRRVCPQPKPLIVLALAVSLAFGSFAATAAPLDDFETIVRIPLDGVPRRARVKASYTPELAEVRLKVNGRVARDVLDQIRAAAQARAPQHVTAVLPVEGARGTELRFLVTRPAMKARVVASDRRRGWFLEFYVHRSLKDVPDLLSLPMVPYTKQMEPPARMTRKRVPVQVQDAWLVLADAEAALLAGDYDEAQTALDLLGNAPPVVVQWATLRQADLHIARKEFPQALAVLQKLTQGSLAAPVALLALARGAGLKRFLGEDACPGLLVDQVLHNEGIPKTVKTEMMARRARALYLEGRFGEALEAFSVLRRIDSSHPALDGLQLAMQTARFRAVLTAMKRGRPIDALTAVAMLPPKRLSNPIDRSTARLEAEAARSLGLFDREIDVRLRLLLEPIDKTDAAEQLAALVETYAASGSHERARLSLRYLREQHTATVDASRLREVQTALDLAEGRFGRAVKGMMASFTDGLTTAREALARLQVARFLITEKGLRGVLPILEGLSRQRLATGQVGDLNRSDLSGLYDEARAVSGRCHELLIELASGDTFRVIDDPARALRLARCAVDAGGVREAASMLEALAKGRSLLSRMARAELAHLRWMHGNGREVATFLSERTARSARTAPKEQKPAPAPKPTAAPAQEIEG